MIRVLLFLVILVFSPSLVTAQETVIVPDAPPPAGTDWPMLLTLGVFYVVTGAGLARKQVPQLVGWPTPLLLVPALSIGVAMYQVGPADLKLLAKHAGLLYLTAYGGHEGGKRLLTWLLGMVKAYREGKEPPTDPPLVEAKKPSIPPALTTLGCFVLALVGYAVLTGCGPAQHPCVTAYDKARTDAEIAEVDATCAHMLLGGGGAGGAP